MRIFKNAWFRRFAKRERISDKILQQVIERADRGLVDANLGGNVIKQCIARPGQGKSGGFRTIIVGSSSNSVLDKRIPPPCRTIWVAITWHIIVRAI